MAFKIIRSVDELSTLDHSDMHVWLADTSHFTDDLPMLKALLSDIEVAQAERFVKEADRRRYIFSHGLLRLILSTYVGAEASSLLFDKREGGKPRVILSDDTEIEFNMSHSEDKVIIGFAKTAVGVDIEFIQNVTQVESIIERICTDSERDLFLKIRGLDLFDAFFRCWTLKEAFVKAIGKGLSFPMDEVEVDFLSEEPFKPIKDNNSYYPWVLRSLEIVGNYQAAIANKDIIENIYYVECTDLGVFNLL